MEPELTWLATELGLPVLEETDRGLAANGPARVALGGEIPHSLEEGAAALAGLGPADTRLLSLLGAARAGQRVTLRLAAEAADVRLMASPTSGGRVRVTIISSPSARRPEVVDMAAAVAHEVANAVGAIAGWAELGKAGQEAEVDPHEALALIATCARTAEQAARRMLDVARGDHGEHVDSVLDASQLSRELLELLTITARQARVALVTSIEPGLALRGSRGHWFTILWNLVKNAIEASAPASRVQVELYEDHAGLRLDVRDQGPGLDAAAQASIFQPYVTSKAHGTGLGLPLVKQAVEALGGRLTLDSTPGSGSTFRVVLPRASRESDVSSAVEATPRPESEEAPKGSQILDARVLVVEDDDALREMVATALSLRGARVTTVRGAAEALALEDTFDAALIDMTLEEARGDELLAQLRKRGLVNAAMLVTGSVQKPRLVPGGEPDDWVRKPFELSQLVDRLKRTLERHRMLSAATASMRR